MKIISASRRCDMVAFQKDYLKKKYRDMGDDAFWVFWTKNPKNLIDFDLDYTRSALQLTVTGLGGTDLERGVPEPAVVMAEVEKLVSKGFNPDLINWRFDPIIPGYSRIKTATVLADQFAAMGVTRCMTSFITWYGPVKTRWPEGEKTQVSRQREKAIIQELHNMLQSKGIVLYGCAQPHLTGLIQPSKCIDGEHYGNVTGRSFNNGKDFSQRQACGCTVSVDIGKYTPCGHKCLYCYAVPEEEAHQEPSLF